ncbi:MAG: FAD-dependent oxidoreductase [Chitinophagales bacterium]|nr:FAD-dependent oxidoreductase [Chitinophagales bacterium]
MLDVVIVGAGLSGLTACHHLQSKGYKVKIYESKGKVGGRCRSDYINGFILDRGLHVFCKESKYVKSSIQTESLYLSESIYPGALVYKNRDFNLVPNPLRRIKDSLSLFFNSFMTYRDKWKMANYLSFLISNNEDRLKKYSQQTIEEFLRKRGFDDYLLNSFFRSIHAAIFFDDSLQTPSNIFNLTVRQIILERASLPAYGIGSIPEQINEKLEKGSIVLHSKVKQVFSDGVELQSGEFVQAKTVLVTVPEPDIQHILSGHKSEIKYNRSACMYFATKNPPVNSPIFVLNGTSNGLVNYVFVPSTVQPSYAPSGSHLVCVSLNAHINFENESLIEDVLKELIDWFGLKVNDWTHLKTYQIEKALPKIEDYNQAELYRMKEGIFFCGDYFRYGNIVNAIKSGAVASKAIDTYLHSGEHLLGRSNSYSSRASEIN